MLCRRRVFLCHSTAAGSKSNARVEEVRAGLRARNYRVFYFKASIPAGTSFTIAMMAAADACDLFVFFVSPASVDPVSFCHKELARIERRWRDPSNRVLPVRLDESSAAAIPYLHELSILQPTEAHFSLEVCDAVDRLALRLPWSWRGWLPPNHLLLLLAALAVTAVSTGAMIAYFEQVREHTLFLVQSEKVGLFVLVGLSLGVAAGLTRVLVLKYRRLTRSASIARKQGRD